MQDGQVKKLNLNKAQIRFKYPDCVKYCIMNSTESSHKVVDTLSVGVQTIETNSFDNWDHSFENTSFVTTFVWDHGIWDLFIWNHIHVRPHSFETYSFETTFIWDHIYFRSHSFYVTLKWSCFDYCKSHFYDLRSTSLQETWSFECDSSFEVLQGYALPYPGVTHAGL